MVSRGIRNNNPGNIDYNATKWLGQLPHDPKIEPRFCRFKDPVYGIRALCKLILTYNRKYGINTVAGIITRWAPSVENNTAAYIAQVARACQVDSTEEISVQDMLPYIVPAIIRHENGSQPYSADTIARAIAMALGK